ncbi:MAG: GntR family transcriptional regulator [Thermoactinomyces sp.]
MSKNSKIDVVVETIQKRIIEGKYVAGQRLPAERELAEEFGVSRPTIRTALLRLQSNNLIDIVPRGGLFVRSNAPKVVLGGSPKNKGPELQKSGSFIHTMRAMGRDVLVRYLEPSSIIPAGKEIGAKLDIPSEDKVLRRYRVQLIDRVPYRILDTYLLADYTQELVGQEDHQIPLFKWLRENKKLIPIRTHERLNCRMPTAEEAAILHIGRNQPVVEMDRWIWGKPHLGESEEEVLFEYSKIVANASLHEFAYTYEISEEASK